jgi:hypothetical protein
MNVRRAIARSGWRAAAGAGLVVASAVSGWLGCSGDDAPPPAAAGGDAAVDAPVVGPDGAALDSSGSGQRDDAGAGADTGAAVDAFAPKCAPALVGTPSWKPPSTYPRAACTDAQITRIVSDCYTALDVAKCAADKAALPGCAACLVTDEGAPALGPIIQAAAFATLNLAGCEALETADASATACPALIGVVIDCEALACAAGCTAAGSSSAQYHTCRLSSTSDGGPCAAAYAATAACGEDDPDAGGICYFGTADSFLTYVQRVAPLFCGGGAGDAGVPDAADAGD